MIDAEEKRILANHLPEMVAQFYKAYLAEKEAKALRKSAAEGLVKHMESMHVRELVIPDQEAAIVFQSHISKRPTKTAIVDRFGDEGVDFWKDLPDKISEWLTVIKK